jgi:general nucleoside transport system ATP-binding protein
LMVGREVDAVRRTVPEHAPGVVALDVEGISARGDRGGEALRNVSLRVRAGEIVGVAGVAGNGQRELAETVSGMRSPSAGTIEVAGRALRRGDPRAAIAAGVAHVPEDRLGTGLAPSLSISRNAVMKTYRSPPLSWGPVLRLRRMADIARSLITRYDVKAPGPETPVRNLSGGNLQKLVLGREFQGDPIVLIAAQPTRGLDVGAIETVHGYLREAAADGVAVLMISEDLDEILALADRVAVMYEGAIVGELDASAAGSEEIGFLMAGGKR